MALNNAQRDVILEEIYTLANNCRANIIRIDGVRAAANNYALEIIALTRVLLKEITMSEHIHSLKDRELREYYSELMEANQAPSAYRKKGYGPNHGKGRKKKEL